MAKKDKYVPHQDPEFNKAQGRPSGEAPKSVASERERNVGHKEAEEHNRVEKGTRDPRAGKPPS